MKPFHPRSFLRQLLGRTPAPAISVVVPVYDSMPYFKDCLDHLLGQTIGLAKLEIIVVSDGSTDGSIALAKRSRRKLYLDHPRLFQIKKLPHFGSPSKARNWGIEHARGRYIFFCDSDDWLNPDACRRLVKHADKWGSDLLFGRFATTDRFPRVRTFEQANEKRVNIFCSSLFRTLTACRLFRREFILQNQIRFPERLVVGEDMFFTLQAYAQTKAISIAADYPYYHSEQYDTSIDRANLTQAAPLEEFLASWPEHVDRYVDWVAANQFVYSKLARHLVLQVQLTLGKPYLSELLPAFAVAVRKLYVPGKVRAGNYLELRQKLCLEYLFKNAQPRLEDVESVLTAPLRLAFSQQGRKLVLSAETQNATGVMKVTCEAQDFAFVKKLNVNTFLLSQEEACLVVQGCLAWPLSFNSEDLRVTIQAKAKGGNGPQHDFVLPLEAASSYELKLVAEDHVGGCDVPLKLYAQDFSARLDLSPIFGGLSQEFSWSLSFFFGDMSGAVILKFKERNLDSTQGTFCDAHLSCLQGGWRISPHVTKYGSCQLLLKPLRSD